MSKSLFISHATKDKDLVEDFVEIILQIGMDIPANDIFCSSLSGMGIPSGKNFIDYIKEQIQQPKVVIVFFSKAYIDSQFCMCELGATWAMAHNILPILVPPLTHSDIKGVLTGIQVDRVNEADELNRFQEELSKMLNRTISFSKWERKRNQFLSKCKDILDSIKENENEKDEAYLEVEKKYKDAQIEIEQFEKEVNEKNNLIDELKRCKNKDEVENVMTSICFEGEELFNKLIYNVEKELNKLPKVVVYIIYKEKFAKSKISFDNYEEKSLLDAAADAYENKYLIHDEPFFYINEQDIKVKSALKSISELEKFLDEMISEELFNKLNKEDGYEPSLKNKRFWKRYFASAYLL